jgi:hypothetical protein
MPSQSVAAEATMCTLNPARSMFRIAWPIGLGGLVAKAMEERAECFRQVKAAVEALWDPVAEYGRRNPASPDFRDPYRG